MNIIKKLANLRDLKYFLNDLDEQHLSQPITVVFEESPWLYAKEIVITSEDFYVNIDDSEDCGTYKELEEIHGRDFDVINYKVIEPAGTIYLRN